MRQNLHQSWGRLLVVASLLCLWMPFSQAQEGDLEFSKAFGPTTIIPGGISTLTFTIENNTFDDIVNISFTDNLPAGVVIDATPLVTTSCSGIITANPGAGTIMVTNAVVGAMSSCTISVRVTAASVGIYNNTSGNIVYTLAGVPTMGGTASATLTVEAGSDPAPIFTKSFTPNVIPEGGVSTLTFTIDNSGSSSDATMLAFTDNLPAGMTIAAVPNDTSFCTGGTLTALPGSSMISYSGGSLLAGATCTISVDVTATQDATNTSSTLSSSLGTSPAAVASLTIPAPVPPSFSKSFSPSTIAVGNNSLLTFEIDNSGGLAPVDMLAFTDNLPAGMTIADPPVVISTVGGTITAPAGGTSITLSDGSVGAQTVGTISLYVTSSTSGTHMNVSGDLTSEVGNSGNAVADLTVDGNRVTLTKSFNPSIISATGTSTMTFELNNPSGSSVFNASFTDLLPEGLTVATDPRISNDCAASILANPGATNISFFSGSLGPGVSCSFSVDVTSAGPGVYDNITTDLSSSQGSSGSASATLTAVSQPFSKAFTDDPAQPGGTVTLEFRINNPDRDHPMTGITFTDDLDATLSGLSAIGLPMNDVVGAGSTLSFSGGVLTLSNGMLPPGGTVTFPVTLQIPAAASAGVYPNTTSTLTATINGSPATLDPAFDDLFVNEAPLITKTFLDGPVAAGETATVEFTITNTSATASATSITFTDDLSSFLPGTVPVGLPMANVCGSGSNLSQFVVSGVTSTILTGGSLAPGASCTFQVDLQTPADAVPGTYTNITSGVSATVNGVTATGEPASDDLDILGAPVISKQFVPAVAIPGQIVALEYTLSLSANAPADVTNISFTDDLDAALSGLVATGLPMSDVCGTGSLIAGTSLVSFTSGTLSPGQTCTFSIDLMVPLGATPGTYTNTTSSLTGDAQGVAVTSGPAMADLEILSVTFEKEFLDMSPGVVAGDMVDLRFTLTNLSSTTGLSNLSFTDDLTSVLPGLVATGLPMNDVCGTGSSITGTSFLSFSGGSLAPGSSCMFTVTCQIPADAVPGDYTNTSGPLFESGVQAALPASDELNIMPVTLPLFSKTFSPNLISQDGVSTLTFTIDNTANVTELTALDFTDNLPAGVVVATPSNASTTCTGGTLTAGSGTGVITYTGGTVSALSTCTVSVDVTAALAGVYNNTTGDLTSDAGNSGTASATLTVDPPPLFSKEFSPAMVTVDQPSTLIFTIDNSAATLGANSLDFTDNLPAGLVVATPSNASTACTGGTLTAVDGSGVITYTGGSVVGGGSCTVSVDVVSTDMGTYTNTSGDLTSSLGNSGTATDVLTVSNVPLGSINCRDANLSVGSDGTVSFTPADFIPGATDADILDILVSTFTDQVIFRRNSVRGDEMVSFDVCAYLDRPLKVNFSTRSANCWSTVTFKQTNGGMPLGRSKDIWCFDPLLDGGHIDGQAPVVQIPCGPVIEMEFVADWITAYECTRATNQNTPESDTAKIIYREYEAIFKGQRVTVFDTLIVFRLPVIIAGFSGENTYCAPSDTTYCGEGFAGPFMIVPERCDPALFGMDQDGDGVACDTLYFILYDTVTRKWVENPVFRDNKCGLSIHLDYWPFTGNSCEQIQKFRLDVKQDCYGAETGSICGMASLDNAFEYVSPNPFTGIGDPLYLTCEFWLTDLDTLPPLAAAKVLGEFNCFVFDTSLIFGSGGSFTEVIQPVVYTGSHECEAKTYLPPLCVYDDWSGIKSVKARVEGGGTYVMETDGEKCVLLDFNGEPEALSNLEALFGEVLDSIPDELLFLLDTGYCYRSHEKVILPVSADPIRIFYEVYDSCHLVGRDTAYIRVKDGTAPVVAADKGVTVSLSDKKVWVEAETFLESAEDNCGVEMILARRADWQTACVDLCYNAAAGESCPTDSMSSALCWLWTDGHDTLWTLDLEDDKACDPVEAHYRKQLEWLCEDDAICGPLLYNSWLYDLIRYATVDCHPEYGLDEHAFQELFRRAVGDPRDGDMIRIKNPDILNYLDTLEGGLLVDTLFSEENVIELGDDFGGYGVDIFKCQGYASVYCGGLSNVNEEELLLQLLFGNCFPIFGVDFELFIPAIFSTSTQDLLFDSWRNIGGGWSDAVPFSCDDACGPVTVEILVMDYWCNWSKAWTEVWVEDKTPVSIEKDVYDVEEISCKTFKDARYSYPGEIHPVSIEYLVEQSQLGDSAALAGLDAIFGGYCKAWIDPYGNYVDADGVEIECDIPFYDSICYCTSYYEQVKVYDDHLGYLWKDSLVKHCYYEADTLMFQKGIVAVNCAENVFCEQEVWSEIDHCGQGYIFRKWKIWQGCPPQEGYSAGHIPDTITRHQRIWIGNECELDKYMFDVPGDTTVHVCELEYAADGSGQVAGAAGPESTGYATYKFDDDCRIVGIGHEDKVFKVVGGDSACYKIVRTWYFADWCGYGKPQTDNWWYDREFVVDSCVQKIIVQDTMAPVCVITGPVASGDSIAISACDYDLSVTVDAGDACGLSAYAWELHDITDPASVEIVDAGGDALSEDTAAFDLDFPGLSPGTYKVKVTVTDACNNQHICYYEVTIVSAKKPAPVCVTNVTARLVPWDTDQDGIIDTAHAVVWANEFDRSSTPACDDDSLAFRLEFLDRIGDSTYVDDADSLTLGCADFGTHLVRLWVISYPSGTADYCDVILTVQTDFTGCTTITGAPGSINEPMGEQQQSNQVSKRMDGEQEGEMVIPGDFGASFELDVYRLDQNRPNPFRDETVIGFVLPSSMWASITVYDLTGRMIGNIEGDFPKGFNEVHLKSTDLGSTGVMYYHLQTGSYHAVRKMIQIE